MSSPLLSASPHTIIIQWDIRPGVCHKKSTNKTLIIPRDELREQDSEIQLIHGRIKHNSTEILRSDVRKNVATMNLSFNTRAGGKQVSRLASGDGVITRLSLLQYNVSFDSSLSGSQETVTQQLQSCHFIVTRDIIRDTRDSPRVSCPGLICESDGGLISHSDAWSWRRDQVTPGNFSE